MSFLDSVVALYLVMGSRSGAYLVLMLAALALLLTLMFSGARVGLVPFACVALVLLSMNRLRRR